MNNRVTGRLVIAYIAAPMIIGVIINSHGNRWLVTSEGDSGRGWVRAG